MKRRTFDMTANAPTLCAAPLVSHAFDVEYGARAVFSGSIERSEVIMDAYEEVHGRARGTHAPPRWA